MFGGEALMAFPQGKALSRLDETARPLGVFLEIHGHSPPRRVPRPQEQPENAVMG
jgi:hypothetical protein